jgi:4-hydroxy-tetrahydrodipicolinate synthase
MASKHDYKKGIHTILTTPLTGDFEIDEAGLEKNVRFGADSNAHALVALGTQGEFPTFSTEERKRIAQITVEAAEGKKAVVIGTSHSNTREAVELTQHAQELGADGVLVTPPYFSQVKWDGVKGHFKTLSDECDIDIWVYNAPERAGFNTTPHHLVELAEFDNVVAVKQASRNIMELEETVSVVGDELVVFGGSEAMMWPCFALGMKGSSTTGATFMPQYFVDIYEAAVEGRWEEGKALYDRLAPLRRLAKANGHAAVVKAASELVGLAGGPVRPPLSTPSSEDLADLKGILSDLGAL